MFDEEKVIILDTKLRDITSFIYDEDYNYYYVRYPDSKKIFKYSKKKVLFYWNPFVLDHTKIIKTKNKVLTNVAKILRFNDIIKVFFENGSTKIYPSIEIELEDNLLSEGNGRAVFNYFKEMATHLNISDITRDNIEYEYSKKQDHNDGFLSNIYSKIPGVNKNSVLSKYLSDKHNIKIKDKLSKQKIYPFSFNLSQEKATINAFGNRISIIEGPPGTGKTQTILNIIANAIVDNKTVAVVSNNNTATKNVYDKLRKNNLEIIAAQLGKNDNIKKFVEEQVKNYHPLPQSCVMDSKEIKKSYSKLKGIKNKTTIYLNMKNMIANDKILLDNLKLEQTYFLAHLEKSEIDKLENSFILPNFKADKMQRLLLYLNHFENSSNLFDKKIQFMAQIRFRFYGKDLFSNSIDFIMKNLEFYYYKNKINELEIRITNLEKQIKTFNLENKFEEYIDISMKIFKSNVSKKYNIKHRYDENNIKNTKDFIKDYPVVLSTTYSLLNCTDIDFLYDYIIVDESSQVDLVSAFPALMFGKNAIIVGDSKQLPNIVDRDKIDEYENVFRKYSISSKYNYARNSLLDLTKQLGNSIPIVVLREHYRCHPKIIGFCNKMYYENELIIHTSDSNVNPIKHYKCVPGNHARKSNDSWMNDRQLQVIKEEIIPKENINVDTDSVGIITPYKEQKKYIKREIPNDNLEVDTVHGFQGNEKDIIIFSTVANNITKFLDNPNSLNVAISRAIKYLYLVTPYDYKSNKYKNLISFIDYIGYQNFEVIESKITSIFDLLYKVNSKKKDQFLSKYINRLNIKYLSEKLMESVVLEVLKEDEFSNLELNKANYPLRNLFKDRSILTDRENEYVNNNAHVDFMITNKNNHKLILGIEVDGYKNHHIKEQMERDQVKDSIFKKYGISLLRVGTNECFEKDKLIVALRSVDKFD